MIEHDVRDHDGLARLISAEPRIGVLVNCAGVSHDRQEYDLDRWRTVLELTDDAWATAPTSFVLHRALTSAPARDFLPYLGDYILTSAIKKVDVAVFDTIQSVVNNSFAGGQTTIFDANKGATGLGAINPAVPDSLLSKLQDVDSKIKSGEIAPPDTVK